MATTARSGKGSGERVMKRRNLTSDEAVNRQLWRLESSNRRTAGKLIVTLGGGGLGNRLEVLWGNILGNCHCEQRTPIEL